MTFIMHWKSRLVWLLGTFIALRQGVTGQTVVTLEGDTATFTDVTVPGTGGTVVSTAQGQQMLQLDIFGSTVFPAFKDRVTITNFNNGFRGGTASFVIRNVQKSDAGAFLCQSQFEGQQACGSATLVVAGTPSKPSLIVLTDPVVVGKSVRFECKSTSTSLPATSALKLAYNLKENGRLALPQPTTASQFQIGAISKAKTGARYTCIVYEQNTLTNKLTGLHSEDSDPYVMNPLYAPDSIVLNPPKTNYVVKRNEAIPDITCSADCNPACNFNWYKDSHIFQSGNTLSVGTADKVDAGNYFCRAANTVDSKDEPLIITVEDKVNAPELSPPTTNYTVPEGTALEDIFCRADCTPACSYTWLKDGRPVLQGEGIRLGSVVPRSSGTYTCQATNGQESSQVSFTVNVLYGPKKPAGKEIISPETRGYHVQEGAVIFADIVCDADCNPDCSVQWTKTGGPPLSSGKALSLGLASRDDTGSYTCTVSNDLGQTSTTVDVSVEYGPEQISLDPSTLHYNSVENVDVFPDIRCSAVCEPECVYAWYKGDAARPFSDTAVLSLGSAGREDTGAYRCLARNKVGQATVAFDAVVLYGPANATLEPPQTNYTVPSGTLLPPVTCSADCNPTCRFTWIKDNSAEPITTLKTLTLGQADPQISGIYRCEATNDYGTASAKFDLTVRYGPSTISFQPPQNVHDLSKGDNLTVTCEVTCDPACRFHWEDESGNLITDGKTLQLSDVTSQDAGAYTCETDNSVSAPARRTVVVNVLIGPNGNITISPPGPTIPLKLGNSIILMCAAECSPACAYRWLKNSQELPSSNGILTLNDVNRDHNGAYTCEASNSVGNGAKEVILEIQYGPGNSLNFTPNKTSYPIEENSDLNVTCSADCRPPCEYVWKRGSADIASGPVLRFEALQRNQAGSYRCIADNIVQQPSNRQIRVDVLYGPSEVRMFPDEVELYPIKGSTVSLKCWAVCNPACAYSWYEGSSLLPNSSNGELQIQNVTTADSGNYLCVASNGIGDSASRTVDINVRAGPGTSIRFNPPDETVYITEGKQLKVECIAECSPPCTYQWKKGSALINEQSILEFADTDRTKAGSYICLAANDADSHASKPLSLHVQYGPGDSIALFPPGQNQSYTEGAPLNIKCSAECDPPCTYKWYLGPTLLPYEDGVLFSDSARLDQAGTYTCQASNNVGSASSVTVTVDIQTGPGSTISFTPPGNRHVVKAGNDLLVTCSADCSPACTYKWIFHTEELPTSNGRLELLEIAPDQKGLYTCVADNGYGNQGTKPLTIDVEYGPDGTIELFPTNSTQVLNEGASISLKCSADCNPRCNYSWFLGNEVINSTNGVVSLIAVGPGDAGTYRCSAGNSISLAFSDTITVVVQTGPGNTVKIEPAGAVYEVTEGQQLQMRCSAVCSPPCTYTWYFGFDRVKSDDGILIIDDVPRNTTGPFVCYAANDVGLQGSRLIQVNVLYGPSDGIILDPASDITVMLDNPFSLRCSANCRPPCQYTWFHGPLPRDSEGGKMSVGKATIGEGGSYTCRATNDVGSLVSEPIQVIVQYGPRDSIRLQPEGPKLKVKEGDDITITCSADCKPECQYSWFAGSELVPSEQGKLTIQDYQRTQPHFYTCFADNGLGNRAVAVMEVQVQYGPGGNPVLFPDTSPLTATVGGSVSVKCSSECSPPCNYTWTKDGEVVPTPSEGVLQLRDISVEQAGTYVCTASNGVGPSSTTSVDVQLQSGPGASIRFNPPSLSPAVMEGDTLQVECAAECAPECAIRWTRDGKQVSTSGQLQLSNIQRTQAGVYQCNAQNTLGVNVTQQLTVTVEYGPTNSTKLFPPAETRNLNRGETLNVQCSALCSPPCTYTWRKGEQQLSTEEGILLLPNVTPDDGGRYTCTASNGNGPSESVSLTLDVNFGPEDTVTFEPPGNNRQLREGDTLRVQCAAQCLPSCSYTWYLGTRRLNSSQGLLLLPAVTRQDAGTYTCHADNGVGRRKSKEMMVDVEYPPDTPTFDPATTEYTIRERIDSISDIRCFADCNPRCDIQWLKNGFPLDTTGNVLALPVLDRSADGVYTCVASNPHGSLQKDLTIHVNYAPDITLFTINDHKTEATVPEKYPVTLNCRVSSKPPSTIQIFNGSQVIKEMKNALLAKYAWKQAECLDAGIYSCSADNSVGARVLVSAELKVYCLPRLDPRVFKQPYVAAELGQTAVISVPVLGYPPPSFLWFKIRDGVPSVILENTNATGGHSDKFFTVNGTTSTLTIENVQLTDFGDYLVAMVNNQGTSNITFYLVPRSVPYPARNLTTRPVNPQTVEVTWSPGFNGGSKQQFLLEYLKQDTNGWRALELNPNINDVTRSITTQVSDLNPSTLYKFRVRSRNVFGLSNYSNEAEVLTPASPDAMVSSGEVNPTPVLLGVGLALGFLVGAGITAIVVVSKCRPKTSKHGDTIDDFRSDTTYDTLYLRDALWAQRHIKMRQNSGSHRNIGQVEKHKRMEVLQLSLPVNETNGCGSQVCTRELEIPPPPTPYSASHRFFHQAEPKELTTSCHCDGGLEYPDSYDYKQPDDTILFHDYSSNLKPVGEMRTSL